MDRGNRLADRQSETTKGNDRRAFRRSRHVADLSLKCKVVVDAASMPHAQRNALPSNRSPVSEARRLVRRLHRIPAGLRDGKRKPRLALVDGLDPANIPHSQKAKRQPRRIGASA